MSSRQLAAYLAYRGLGAALQWLPEPVGRAATMTASAALGTARPDTRRLAESHLRRVLASTSPVVDPDPALVRRWANRSFRAYGHYWLEASRLPAMSGAEVARRMPIPIGMEHLQAALATGQGAILALPHVGSWEWGGAYLASVGIPMTSVAERVEPPQLFDWFVGQRRAMGLDIVPLDRQAGTAVLGTLRRGGLVGLLGDRDIEGNGVAVELFGETTTLPAGPATMALRTGATLLAGVVYTGPRRLHSAVISPPIPAERLGRLRSDVQRVTQAVAVELEHFIRRAPEQWHLFQPNWPSDPQ